MKTSFATAINCMDGRAQEPVIRYLKEKYNVQNVDMITEPGPNKILAEGTDKTTIDSIKRRVDISVNAHGSKVIAIIGHYDCAGNLESQEVQCEDLKKSVEYIRQWNYPVEVITALWLDEDFKVSCLD